ncbi:HAAS signaling domain-containing protein [Aquibacillus halophilus]|nr:DUF1700 domain-containing protein [Aquibacillus halophilus]
MKIAEKQFIEELSKSLPNSSNKQEILKEYEMHLYEMAREGNCEDDLTYYNQLKDRLGTPQEIANIW